MKSRKTTDKRRVPVEIRKDGEFIAVFSSVRNAAQLLGLNEKKLSDVLRGRQRTTGGYSAQYFDRKYYGGR